LRTLDSCDTKKEEDTLLLAAASTPALTKAFAKRTMSIGDVNARKTQLTALSNDNEQGGYEHVPQSESEYKMSYGFDKQTRP